MDIPSNEDLVPNYGCNTQNMSLATDCDLITFDFGDQIGTTIPNVKVRHDLVINDDVIQNKDLNKSKELSSKVEEVLLNMHSMRVINMTRDEKIDKILESISYIETMISQLNDEDDLIELDKRTFTHDDAFNIKINMDKPVSPTIRAATKKKNISKSKTIMGHKKLPFTLPAGVRKPKIEPKSFNKSKTSYTLSQPTKDYRRPVYFFSITNLMKCKFMPTPTMRLLEDQIKACAYAFSASLDPS
ncbi:hypothetical protein S245_031212 [Arachis hypogaea]